MTPEPAVYTIEGDRPMNHDDDEVLDDYYETLALGWAILIVMVPLLIIGTIIGTVGPLLGWW